MRVRDVHSFGSGWKGWHPLKVPEHAHPLVRWIFEECNRQQRTLTSVCEEAGVTVPTVRGWKSAHSPYLPVIEAIINALGHDLLPVRKIDDRRD